MKRIMLASLLLVSGLLMAVEKEVTGYLMLSLEPGMIVDHGALIDLNSECGATVCQETKSHIVIVSHERTLLFNLGKIYRKISGVKGVYKATKCLMLPSNTVEWGYDSQEEQD